jgi:hypothetical protein
MQAVTASPWDSSSGLFVFKEKPLIICHYL